MLFMAWVFDGSGLMPLVLRMCLRVLDFFSEEMAFAEFHLIGVYSIFFLENLLMWLRCSSAVLMKMMMSSR